MNINIDRQIAASSAAGVAIHTPVTPRSAGSTSIAATINTKDLENAWSRARNEAAPINAQRFGLDTPCCKTGSCFDCKNPDTICCQFLVTRYSKHPNRIKVILVNEDLGF